MRHSSEVYDAVALLHANYIDRGFLSSLGVPFLRLLYEAIDADEDSVLLVEKVDGVVVGYVSGATGMGSIFKQLLWRLPRVVWALIPSLLSPSRIYKIAEILFRPSANKSAVELPAEELLSIVVDPSQQGEGYAEKLFVSLCKYFDAKGVPEFRIVVGIDLARAHQFYKKMGSIVAAEVEVHQGERSLVYVKQTI